MSLFKGVCTAMITPLTRDGIDFKRLKANIDFQIENGVDAILLSGTTGESPTLNDREKTELFQKGAEFIDKRVPFVAGTGTNNTEHIIQMSEIAQKAGADALLVNNPYYNKSSDDGIYASFEAISNAVNVPIIVYNVPSRTGKNITSKLGIELSKIKNVKAFKEASGDISQIGELIAGVDENIDIYSGNDDQTLATLALGGKGIICTTSNIHPSLCCEMTDAFFEGNLEKSRQKQFELLELINAMFCECNPIPVKTAMMLLGRDSGIMRLPLIGLNGAKLDYLKKVLTDYGFEVV